MGPNYLQRLLADNNIHREQSKLITIFQHFVQREENQTRATTVNDKPLSTVGIDISHLIFEGKIDGKPRTVEFRTWDFAGQV